MGVTDPLQTVYYNSTNNLIDPNPSILEPNGYVSVFLNTVVSIDILSPANHGVATIVGKQISYTPTSSWIGTDTFVYSMVDVIASSATTNVVVITTRIIQANDIQLTVAVDSVDNAFKPTSLFDDLWDTPAISTPPVYGTATIDELLIKYTPAPGWVGTEEFTHTIQDLAGNVSLPATVTVTVE